MELNMVLGIYGLDDQSHFHEFLTKLEESGIKISSCERRYKKSGINDYLEKNPEIDTLIISEFLESAYPYTIKEFEHIIEKKENLNIIPIMVNERKGKEYMTQLFQLGIYNALFENDAYAGNIARLLLEGRSRKKAKEYYGVREGLESKSSFNIESCVHYIENAREPDEKICNARYVRERITYQEFALVLSALSEESRKEIKEIEEFKLFFLNGFEQKKENNKASKLPAISAKGIISSTKSLFCLPFSLSDGNNEEITEKSLDGKKPILKDAGDTDPEGEIQKDLLAKVSGKESSLKKNRNKTEVIFISSLKHGTGNTFFGISIANFLCRKGQVCFVHHGSKETEYLLYEKISFTMQRENYHNLYAQRGYLVFDCGIECELSKELVEEQARASVKILMCFSDDDYLKRLADFVEKSGDKADEWIFVFNVVPKEKIHRIEKLMNCYDTVFLPIYSNDNTPQKVKKILDQIL